MAPGSMVPDFICASGCLLLDGDLVVPVEVRLGVYLSDLCLLKIQHCLWETVCSPPQGRKYYGASSVEYVLYTGGNLQSVHSRRCVFPAGLCRTYYQLGGKAYQVMAREPNFYQEVLAMVDPKNQAWLGGMKKDMSH